MRKKPLEILKMKNIILKVHSNRINPKSDTVEETISELKDTPE